MTTIEKIRQFRMDHHLSQPELAAMLQVTRSQLTMVENGRRPLPLDAEIRLLELLHRINENEGEHISTRSLAADEVNGELTQIQKELHRRSMTIQLELMKTEEQLQSHMLERAQLAGGLNNIHRLAAVMPAGSSEAAMLDHKKRQKLKRLTCCSEAVQLRLRIKKDLLSAEAKVISHYLAANA